MFQSIVLEKDFFNPSIPLLRRKESAFAISDNPGLWRLHWQCGKSILLSTFYTRTDQACLLWAVITGIIFATAQFTTLDWQTQAILSSGLTLLSTFGMFKLTKHYEAPPLRQVALTWAVLMLGGAVLTDLSIFLGWGQILVQLCPLWLGLSGLGYFFTGIQMRSRAFLLTSLIHLLAIFALPYFSTQQYLLTGSVIAFSTLLMAELQWDSAEVCSHH